MKFKRILVDIEAQRDFFHPSGSCYVRSSSRAAANIYRLFTQARRSEWRVLSTVLRIRPNEQGPMADVPHCVEGTDGERKLARTVLTNRINLGMRNTTDLPRDIFDTYRQVIFEKRYTDIFLHPRAERLITELPPATFIICGAGVAHGIVEAAVGLRYRGFGVILAVDAAADLDDPAAAMALRRMQAKGVIFAPTDEIVAPRVDRRTRSRLHKPRRTAEKQRS